MRTHACFLEDTVSNESYVRLSMPKYSWASGWSRFIENNLGIRKNSSYVPEIDGNRQHTPLRAYVSKTRRIAATDWFRIWYLISVALEENAEPKSDMMGMYPTQNCVVAETLFVLATPMVIGVDSMPCEEVPSKCRDTHIACVPVGHVIFRVRTYIMTKGKIQATEQQI